MKKRRTYYIRLLMGIFITLILCITVQMIYSYRHRYAFPDKIWLHRCNSIQKMDEMDEKYQNIEVDVVFRKDSIFDISHDIDTSFNCSLDSFLGQIDKTNRKIWIDLKNLTYTNYRKVYTKLEQLIKEYSISKSQLILESPKADLLQYFTNKGYYTSMYIKFKKPSDLSAQEIDYYISLLQKVADRKMVSALSFPYWWYTEIKDKLNRPIDLLTWTHHTSSFALQLWRRGQEMLKDEQLKIILVKEKGHFHR